MLARGFPRRIWRQERGRDVLGKIKHEEKYICITGWHEKKEQVAIVRGQRASEVREKTETGKASRNWIQSPPASVSVIQQSETLLLNKQQNVVDYYFN